ncbi:hypothetical protein ACWIGI_11505 [Nocardia sp. NPDC055321]
MDVVGAARLDADVRCEKIGAGEEGGWIGPDDWHGYGGCGRIGVSIIVGWNESGEPVAAPSISTGPVPDSLSDVVHRVTGALLIVAGALSFVGSFATLISTEKAVPAARWTSWRIYSERAAGGFETISPLIGAAAVSAAVVAVVSGLWCLLGSSNPLARWLAAVASGLGFGVALSILMLAGSFLVEDDVFEYQLGAGFWLIGAAALSSLLAMVASVAVSSTPGSRGGRWPLVLGSLLTLTAVVAFSSSFPEFYGGEGEAGHWGLSAWQQQWASSRGSVYNPQLFGVPLVLSSVVALGAGVLLCLRIGARSGRAQIAGTIATGISFGATVTIAFVPLRNVLDEESAVLGPGLWLLTAAAVLSVVALVVALLVIRAPRGAAPVQDMYGNWIPGQHL